MRSLAATQRDIESHVRGGLFVLFIAATLPLSNACGQAAWEYTPYQIRVQLALEPAPQLPLNLVAIIGESISRAESAVGAAWHVETSDAQPKLRAELLTAGNTLSADAVSAASDPADLSADKICLVTVAWRDERLHLAVCEFDCRTRQLGPRIERQATDIMGLPITLWDAILESFTPLARIEHLNDKDALVRLRAGGLVVDPTSRVLVEPGMAMRPIIRRNDKNGQPVKGGIQTPPFTLLSVHARQDSVLQCMVESGYRAPIPARGALRIERLALAVAPRYPATRLLVRSRTEPDRPLVGYEIHVHTGDGDETRLLGVTDTDGAFEIPYTDHGPQRLLVKSGKQLLARLPLVPGQEPTLIARVIDDDERILAEGFTAALTSRALDLVARREILAARIRARLKNGQTAEAQKLLEDFRRLETWVDLNRDLDRYRMKIGTTDRITQSRIERLFADAAQVLRLKPLSDDLLAQLTREVSTGRPGSAAAEKSGGE